MLVMTPWVERKQEGTSIASSEAGLVLDFEACLDEDISGVVWFPVLR